MEPCNQLLSRGMWPSLVSCSSELPFVLLLFVFFFCCLAKRRWNWRSYFWQKKNPSITNLFQATLLSLVSMVRLHNNLFWVYMLMSGINVSCVLFNWSKSNCCLPINDISLIWQTSFRSLRCTVNFQAFHHPYFYITVCNHSFTLQSDQHTDKKLHLNE